MAWNDWGHWLSGGLTTKKGRNFLFGQDEQMKKIPNYTEGQNSILDQLIQQLQGAGGGMNNAMGLLQSMLDPSSQFFKNFENQQMNQFNEQTLPNIAEHFAGGAGGGALSSSGFGQALGGAASGLQSNLAVGKSGMIMDALKQFLNQYNQQTNTALNAQPFSYYQKPASPGFLPQAASMATKAYGGG